MAERSREKIALVIFVVLMMLGLFVASSYIIASHSLNFAATHIDDMVGNMEGYTVIVFDGTLSEQDLERAEADGALSEEDPDSDVSDNDSTAQDDAAGANPVASADSASASEKGSSDDASDYDGSNGQTDSSSESSSPLVTAQEVGTSYRDKGANVFELDTAHPEKYRDGALMKRGGTVIGVFSVEVLTTRAEVESMVKYFQIHDAAYVIAVVPYGTTLRSTEGVDVVVTTDDASASSLGSQTDNTYFVQAPKVGSVGAVLITPSNIVSSKVVSEL